MIRITPNQLSMKGKSVFKIIGVVLLIAIFVGGRLYIKYQRAEARHEKQMQNLEFAEKVKKTQEQKQQDEDRLAQQKKYDSIHKAQQAAMQAKVAKLKESQKIIEQELKAKKKDTLKN